MPDQNYSYHRRDQWLLHTSSSTGIRFTDQAVNLDTGQVIATATPQTKEWWDAAIARATSPYTEEDLMSDKKPRRLRIRRRETHVDEAVLETLVEARLISHTEQMVAKESQKLIDTGYKRGKTTGYNEGHGQGYTEGIAAGTQVAENAQHARAAALQANTDRMTGSRVTISMVNEASPRYENLNNGWGFMTPPELQNRGTAADIRIYAFLPELVYEYRVELRQRVFRLTIWKGYQDGSAKKIEIEFNFTEEALQEYGEGAGALLNFLCTICVQGTKYVDAELLCEFMADWVVSTRGSDDGPTIHVPRSARPTALAKFRDAVGLIDE
jgi:hypothetical protein